MFLMFNCACVYVRYGYGHGCYSFGEGAVGGGAPEDYSSHHIHMRDEEVYQDLCNLPRLPAQVSIAPFVTVRGPSPVVSSLCDLDKGSKEE